MENTDNFYLKKEDPNKSCLLAMREIVLNINSEMTETRKYGMPCFCYKGKALCYLWVDKTSFEPYFLMVDGNLLNHPELETGKRSRMKIFRVNPRKDLPISTIQLILEESLELRK